MRNGGCEKSLEHCGMVHIWFNQIHQTDQKNKTNQLAPCSLEQSHGRLIIDATKWDGYE